MKPFGASDAKIVKDELYPLRARLNVLQRRVNGILGGGEETKAISLALYEAIKGIERAIAIADKARLANP